MLTPVKQMMNQLALSPDVVNSEKRNELQLLRLYSMLDMKYAGDIPLAYLSEQLEDDEVKQFLNPYKFYSNVQSSFSNTFHATHSGSLNYSLLYGTIDPLTVNRSEGIQPSNNHGGIDDFSEDVFVPRVVQNDRQIGVSSLNYENVPLQIIAGLALVHYLSDVDFTLLVDHIPLYSTLPCLLTGLARRGQSVLLTYVCARYYALTEKAKWMVLCEKQQVSPFIAAAQRGQVYIQDMFLRMNTDENLYDWLFTTKTETSLVTVYKSLLQSVQRFHEYFPTYEGVGVVSDYIYAMHKSIRNLSVPASVTAPRLRTVEVTQTACVARKEKTVNQVDVCDHHGFTALLHAAAHNETEVVTYLVTKAEADFRWVSHGAVTLQHIGAPSTKEALKKAIKEQFNARVADRIHYLHATRYHIDFDF